MANAVKFGTCEEAIVGAIDNRSNRVGHEDTTIPASGWARLIPWLAVLALMAIACSSAYTFALAQEPRVVQITADKDNRFKVAGQKEPAITVKAKEVIKFRVTAHQGNETDPKYPGCVHTFSVKELKDQGWDVCLKEGMNEFVLVAPSKPGEYKAECLAKCGRGHDDMAMKVVVQ